MAKKLFFIVACLLMQSAIFKLFAQPDFKYGFGGGVNFSKISELNSYPLFTDINGTDYPSAYSSMFSNIGNQFFFHGEFLFKRFTLALKPGAYTYKFSNTDQLVFNTETLEQTNSYLLRYFQIPLEIKKSFGSGNLKPFIGASASYAQLMQQGGNGTHSFIGPKITASPIAGAYYSLSSFDLVLTAGYNFCLHSITQESDRYNTTSTTPYSQSDIKLNNLFFELSVLFSLEKQDSKGGLDCPSPIKSKSPKLKKVKRK
jgi:hypothetical protein